MAGGGLRVSEVSSLDCMDLLYVDGAPALWVRKGKRGKTGW
jgi:site-specific recombinase XerC